MDESKINVDMGISPQLLDHVVDLQNEVLPHYTGAVRDLRSGLEAMILWGALGLGLYGASRLLRLSYWAMDKKTSSASKWKQLLALSIGSTVVVGLCLEGVGRSRSRSSRMR